MRFNQKSKQDPQIKLLEHQRVMINCPNAEKHGHFYNSFHGKIGTVWKDHRGNGVDSVQVNMAKADEPVRLISVHPDWLSHAKGKRS